MKRPFVDSIIKSFEEADEIALDARKIRARR